MNPLRHIIVKPQNIIDKEKIFRATEEKNTWWFPMGNKRTEKAKFKIKHKISCKIQAKIN